MNKKFIKKEVEHVKKKQGETPLTTPITNNQLTYYNITEQNITLLQNNVDICWTKMVYVATKTIMMCDKKVAINAQ